MSITDYARAHFRVGLDFILSDHRDFPSLSRQLLLSRCAFISFLGFNKMRHLVQTHP